MARMRAVLFDAGGTLLHVDHVRVAAVLQDVLGRTVAPERLAAGEYRGRAAVESAMAAGTAQTDADRWKLHFGGLLEDAGVPADEFERAAAGLIAEHARRHLWTAVQPGTREALEALADAGYAVACISNADGTVASLLEDAGLLASLQFVIDSGLVGVEKPDPRIFHMALDRLGMEGAACYYVGDLYPVDVAGARAAGLVPVLLDPLGRYADRGCRTATDVAAFCRDLILHRNMAQVPS